MPSEKKVHLYRFLQRLILMLFIIWTLGFAFVFTKGELEISDLIAGGGVSLMLLVIFIFIERTVDAWFSLALASTDLIQDDAFASLYERSPVAYITIDQDGKINNANPSAVNLLHGQINTIMGINFYNLLKVDEEAEVEVLQSKVRAGITINDDEIPLNNLAGERIWVILSINSYRSRGQYLVSMVDVTEQKIVDTAKSEFVALATHQLRTPVAAIRWNVELLARSLKETKTESQDRYLVKIERNVIRMINLINDFLSVSKLEMGTYASEIANINLTEFFDSILDEFSEKISEKQLKVNRQDNPPQVVIETDSRLIHIITSNLVSNAVKYINPNGSLTLTYELIGETLEIIVADDGIGIPQVEIEKLFTKFYRASNAQSHQAEGTGLGLYIVKQSVDQLRGTIEVESDEDKGARFVVRVPVTVVSAREID